MPAHLLDPTPLIASASGIPGPVGLLAFLLFVTFALHILLVNALVGVACITFVSRLRGGFAFGGAAGASGASEWDADLDVQSSLLPKGVALAINFAIPPFLILQGLYGSFIYSSSILMGVWWLGVLPVVMLAYYGLYLNMAPRGLSVKARTLALGISLALLLFNAFLLVNNVTLMQNPQAWAAYAGESGGTFLNLADPQLVPRYLHMLLACPAVGGLCLAVPAEIKLRALARVNAPLVLQEHQHARLRSSLSWFFHATLLQLPVGGWFLLSLPRPQQALFMGSHGVGTALFLAALVLTGFALLAAKRRQAVRAALGCLGAALCMVGMRTLLRTSLIEPFYSPQLRLVEVGPLLLFGGSAVCSALLVWQLVRIYRKPDLLAARAVPVGVSEEAPVLAGVPGPVPADAAAFLAAQAADGEADMTLNELALSPLADTLETEDADGGAGEGDPRNGQNADGAKAITPDSGPADRKEDK